MNVVEANERFSKQFNETSKLLFDQAMNDLSDFGDMSEENIRLMQAFVRLSNAALDLQWATSMAIYDIQKKLDVIDAKVSKENKAR